MILRKPYAFLIKNFRLIHIILGIICAYLIYRTNLILGFFNDYVSNAINLSGQDLISPLYYWFVYLAPILIIMISAIIIWLLKNKKKPIVFYIFTIGVYLFTFIMLNVAASVLGKLQLTMLDIRTIRVVRDFLTATFVTQLLSTVIIFIRGTGFDIKKFDFGKDLNELEVEESDNEEFEVEINVDRDKTKRNLRRRIRYAKYVYKENTLLITITLAVTLIAVVITTLIGYLTTPKPLTMNTFFTANSFSMNVTDAYKTSKDFKGNILEEDNIFIIVKIKIKNLTTTVKKLDTATTKLIIGNYIYSHDITYKDSLFDFGSVYNDELLNNQFSIKTLVFKIPKQLANEPMQFRSVNKSSLGSKKENPAYVNLKIQNLDIEPVNTPIKVNELIELKNTILKDMAFSINEFEIAPSFKLNYKFCSTNTKCYDSVEYIKPTLTGNTDKAILKLVGDFKNSENPNKELSSLYDLVENFGNLKYVVNGQTKSINVNLKEIRPISTKLKNTYYIEIPYEALTATNINLVLSIRNQSYELVLR